MQNENDLRLQVLSDALRLQTLEALKIIDTQPEELFNEITQLACSVFNVPISHISLLDAQHQWFKSIVGISVCEISIDLSFCSYTICEKNKELFIDDTLNDPRFNHHPMVTGEPHLRFYAGISLMVHLPHISMEPQPVGTLCILDYKEKTLNDIEKEQLRSMSRQVAYILQLRYEHIAYQQLLIQHQKTQKEFVEQNKKLSLLARQQRIIIDKNPSAIMQIDSNQHIILWSNSAEEMFGYTAAETINKTPHLIVPQQHFQTLQQGLSKLLNGEQLEPMLAKNICKNGATVICKWYYKPIENEFGETEGVLCFAKEITEQWEQEKQLKAHHKQLEEQIAQRTNDLQQSLKALEITQNQIVEGERHKAIGQTVAGIAQDINAPIYNAHLLTQNIKEHLDTINSLVQAPKITRSSILTQIKKIEDTRFMLESNLATGTRLLQNFKQLSVDHVKEPLRYINIPELISQNIEMLNYRINDNMVPVHVHSNCQFLLQSYPGTIGQVLQNIFLNSFEHGFLQEFSGSLFVDILGYTSQINNQNAKYKQIDDFLPKNDIKSKNEILRNLSATHTSSIISIKEYALSGPLNHGLFWSPSGFNENDFFDKNLSNTFVYLRICDTGKGVNPKMYPRIFEPYFSSNKDMSAGSGIGLSIVRHIVEHLLKGRIAVRSIPNIGFEVHLIIPQIENSFE